MYLFGSAFALATRSAIDVMPEFGLHEQHVRRVHQLRDRREVLDRIVGQALEQAGVHRDRGRGEQQRVAVRVGARHHRDAEVAAAAGAVVDDHALPERLRQRLRQDARDDVGRPARPRTARSW